MAIYNYKKLLSEKDLLKVKARARALMGSGSDLVAIYYNQKQLVFKTRSGTDRNIVWTQVIEINDATLDLVMGKTTFKDVEDLIKNSGLRVHCNCLGGDTRILTRGGFKQIKDITAGDWVLSSDGKWHEVAGLRVSEIKDNWKYVKLRGVRDKLLITTDHKVLLSSYRDYCACGCGKLLRPTSDNTRVKYAHKLYYQRMFLPKHACLGIRDNFERYQMKPLKDYKLGELFCGVMNVEESIPFSSDYARMLGYYLAEGHIPKKGSEVQIALNQNELTTIAQDICDYFESVGVPVRVQKQDVGNQHWLTVHIYSKKFREDCKTWCGQGSKTKAVNPLVLNWPRDAKENFLVGHLLGDGAVDDSFRWMSTSVNLIDGLSLVLNSLGIHSSTYIAQNKRAPHSTLFVVSCTLNAFYEVYSAHKSLFREKDLVERNRSVGQNDVDRYVLYTVESIEDAPSQVGYDIVLADDPHNFVANGVIVSNCPAYKYWGMQNKGTRMGYALIPEYRRPTKSNRMPGAIPMVCFAAGTRVLTSAGYKAIESVNVGDWVFTHKGRLRQVMSVSSHLADEVLDVRIGKATHVVCTPNHRFYAVKNTFKGNPSTRKVNIRSVDWVPADALKPGDFLMHPFLQLEHTIQVDNTLAFMAGLYAGDGSIQCEESDTGRGSACNETFRVSGMQIALDNLYKEDYYRLFDSLGVEYSGDNLQEGTSSCTIRITDKRVRQFCLDTVNFTCSSKNQSKKLDSSVLHWNEEAQWAFIKGFFMADGTVVKGSGKKENNHSYITLFNTNFDIMSKLHILLSQWYDVDLMHYDRSPFEENGRVVYPKRMYYIRLTGAAGADFSDKVAYFMQFKRQGGDLDFTGYRESTYNYLGTDYVPKIIKEVTSGEGCKVYNLEVAEDESYLVEGLAVHNCKHLYLVLQLYPFWSKTLASKFRNYYYKKEEDKEGINRLDRVRQNQANRDFAQKQEQQKQQNQINVDTATEQDLEDLLSQ